MECQCVAMSNNVCLVAVLWEDLACFLENVNHSHCSVTGYWSLLLFSQEYLNVNAINCYSNTAHIHRCQSG
jgi:hypothetical protein